MNEKQVIKLLKKKGYEIKCFLFWFINFIPLLLKQKTIVIDNVEYEIVQHDNGKKLSNIKIPKDKRLLKLCEATRLWNLGYLGENWFFVENPNKEMKKEGKVARFITCSDYGELGSYGDSSNSEYDLGVVFAKDLGGKKYMVEVDGSRYIKKDSSNWLDIPELKISVELEVHDKDKSYDELNLSTREDELLTSEQCSFLANSKYAKQLKMDGSSTDDFFIKQPVDFNMKNGYVLGYGQLFYVVRFLEGCDCVSLFTYFTSNSFSFLGIRFCKKLENKFPKNAIPEVKEIKNE